MNITVKNITYNITITRIVIVTYLHEQLLMWWWTCLVCNVYSFTCKKGTVISERTVEYYCLQHLATLHLVSFWFLLTEEDIYLNPDNFSYLNEHLICWDIVVLKVKCVWETITMFAMFVWCVGVQPSLHPC